MESIESIESMESGFMGFVESDSESSPFLIRSNLELDLEYGSMGIVLAPHV